MWTLRWQSYRQCHCCADLSLTLIVGKPKRPLLSGVIPSADIGKHSVAQHTFLAKPFRAEEEYSSSRELGLAEEQAPLDFVNKVSVCIEGRFSVLPTHRRTVMCD